MHLVIRNIFDNSAYNQNVDIDFSSVDTRVTEAEFINDGTQLRFKYYSGENNTINEKLLIFNTTGYCRLAEAGTVLPTFGRIIFQIYR